MNRRLLALFLVLALFAGAYDARAFLTPLFTTIVTGLFGNGSVAHPSVSFTNDTTSGIYLVGAGAVGLAASGVNGLNIKLSTSGNFANIGLGGVPSTSPNFIVLAQRDTTSVGGPLDMLFSNISTDAGNGTKIQVAADNYQNTMEMSAWTATTSSPAAYGTGTVANGVLRATSSEANFGLALVADTGSGSNIYLYPGGNGSSNLAATFSGADLSLTLKGLLQLPVQGSGVTPTCGAGNSGRVAFTHLFLLCVCNGSAWVTASTGSVSCTF